MWHRILIPGILAVAALGSGRQTERGPEVVPVLWLEPASAAAPAALPAFKQLGTGDPRRPQAERMIDNEAAHLIRSLIAAAWRMTPRYTTGSLPALPIVLRPGGNNARQGFRIVDGDAVTEMPDVPYVELDFTADRLSLTLLHEGGHVVQRIVRAGRRAEADWSPVPHSTFAVTDPVTALAEGFAIHLETLWGHYGRSPDRRAYYHRTNPEWHPDTAVRGELFAPVRDIMTFSQNWARYQAVRDGLPVFEGHVYPGDYLRSQYDPARNRARLRTGSAMVASEGTVASVLFWIAQGHAQAAGAVDGGGLDQPGVFRAELELVAALRDATAAGGRPVDLIDIVTAHGADGSAARRMGVERLVAITKGATVTSAVGPQWEALYSAAIGLNIQRARALIDEVEVVRRESVDGGIRDPRSLRAAVGPILPVQLDGRQQVELTAFGKPFTVELDLNALGAPELVVLAANPPDRTRIQTALAERPFASYDDFERRTGVTLVALRATRMR